MKRTLILHIRVHSITPSFPYKPQIHLLTLRSLAHHPNLPSHKPTEPKKCPANMST